MNVGLRQSLFSKGMGFLFFAAHTLRLTVYKAEGG